MGEQPSGVIECCTEIRIDLPTDGIRCDLFQSNKQNFTVDSTGDCRSLFPGNDRV